MVKTRRDEGTRALAAYPGFVHGIALNGKSEGDPLLNCPRTCSLLPTWVACPVVLQGSVALLFSLFGQFNSPGHVAAELTTVFLMDDTHFSNSLLQIVSCRHGFIMKFVSINDCGD